MEDIDFKKINIGENFMQHKQNRKSNKYSRNKTDNISQLKPLTVKELLLQKLKQYKKDKSRKNRKVPQITKPFGLNPIETPSLTASFEQRGKRTHKQRIYTPIMNRNYNEPVQPEYGNLKNGIKPTYRQYQKNKTMRKANSESRIKVEVEKKMNLGRNNTQKKVGVFIKSNDLRRKVNNEKVDIQRSNIKTVKNYLKTQNLIKFGTHAPNDLLREIYSSSKLSGDVYNINGKSLVHNYMNNEM
tara:strand:+ start:6358 stop:7086 length:729 start_codon:yes stop_codon:yes gene_type:complete